MNIVQLKRSFTVLDNSCANTISPIAFSVTSEVSVICELYAIVYILFCNKTDSGNMLQVDNFPISVID